MKQLIRIELFQIIIKMLLSYEITHMNGHCVSLNDHVNGLDRAHCSGDLSISVGNFDTHCGVAANSSMF
jgi:hypothetical protein